LTIYTYGFMVFLGVISGYYLALNQAVKKGVKSEVFSDMFFWSLLWGFVGARLFYIIIEGEYFLQDPWGMLFGRSGFVFYGGILTGLAVLYFLSRRHKIKFFDLLDALSPGVAFGHALGRVGCFFYGCCYGGPTNSWIGVLFPADSPAGQCGVKLIPTQLIEAAFLLLLFLILFVLNRFRKYSGQTAAIYLILYGAFRFVIEFFRADPRGQFLGLATSQWISLGVLVFTGLAAAAARKTK